jgi:hypothetical protein
MRRLFLLFVSFVFLLGCATSKSFETLERRIATLEEEQVMDVAAGVGAIMRIRGFYGLTSADSGPGYNLAAKATINNQATDFDMAIGRVIDETDPTKDGYLAVYYFLSTNNDPEDLPRIVRPADRSADPGRWIMVNRIYAQEFYSDIDDGGHMFNVSNSGVPTYSGPTDWDMTVNRTKEHFAFYDAAGYEWVKFKHGKVLNFTGNSAVPYSAHWGGIVTNAGQTTGPITFTLEQAEKGMKVTFFLLAGENILIDPDISDKFVMIGITTFTEGDRLGSSGPTIGSYVKVEAVENGSGNYDWAVFPSGLGDWVDSN